MVTMPDVVRAEQPEYPLHPALLDACFQLLGVALPPTEEHVVFVPIGVEDNLSGVPVPSMRCTARVQPLEGGTAFAGDVTLAAPDGLVIAQVRGMRFQRVSREALAAQPLQRSATGCTKSRGPHFPHCRRPSL